MSERFLYSVNPKRVIKNIPGVPAIKTPKSLYLSKDEVCSCLKLASVYRRFANEARVEKVTIANVDRLHNARFMTEEEYKKFLEDNIAGNRGSVINTEEPDTEPVVDETTEEVETVEETVETVEEAVEETETVEETTEEINEEEVVETVEEANGEPVVEETTEEVETVEETVETVEEAVEETETVENTSQNNFQNKNYGGKNKHRR